MMRNLDSVTEGRNGFMSSDFIFLVALASGWFQVHIWLGKEGSKQSIPSFFYEHLVKSVENRQQLFHKAGLLHFET